MKVGDDIQRRVKRGGQGTIFLVGLAVALTSALVLNTIGLFFLEFGDELCRDRPSGTILSDPNGWSCDLRLQGVVLGVGLFGLYSLPYGLIVAWLASRSRYSEYLGFPSTVDGVRWAKQLLFFLLVAGIVGALVLLSVLLALFTVFELMLIPVMALASLGLGILILVDCSRDQAPTGYKPGSR